MSCKLEEALKDMEALATKPGAKSIAKELMQISADTKLKLRLEGLKTVIQNTKSSESDAVILGKIRDGLKGIPSNSQFTLSVGTMNKMNKMEELDKAKADRINTLSTKDKKLYSILTGSSKSSNKEYTNYLLSWLKTDRTKVEYTNEVMEIVSNAKQGLAVKAADYNKITNTVRVMLKDVDSSVVENKVRAMLYATYLDYRGLDGDRFDEAVTAFETNDGKEIVREFTNDMLKLVNKVEGDTVLMHELVHANAVVFMENNPEHKATKRVKELYDMAMSKQQEIDNAMQETDIVGKGYWTTNVDEFLAEGLTNPDLMAALANIPVKGKERLSMLDKLIEAVVDMLGFADKEKDNVYTMLLDSMLYMVKEQSNTDVRTKMNTANMFANIDKTVLNKLTKEQLDIIENNIKDCK